jgi:hypothetical protein
MYVASWSGQVGDRRFLTRASALAWLAHIPSGASIPLWSCRCYDYVASMWGSGR